MDELETLLRAVTGGSVPNRQDATSYSQCRSTLLLSPFKDMLPGFLYQCMTILKFKEFITLYDPDIELRDAFVRRSFERCRKMTIGAKEVPPVAIAQGLRQW